MRKSHNLRPTQKAHAPQTLCAYLGQSTSPPKKAPKIKPNKNSTAPNPISTFLTIAEAGLKNKNKVLVQLYPDFLRDVAREIKKQLKTLENYQTELFKNLNQTDEKWKDYPEKWAQITVKKIQKLEKENAKLKESLLKTQNKSLKKPLKPQAKNLTKQITNKTKNT